LLLFSLCIKTTTKKREKSKTCVQQRRGLKKGGAERCNFPTEEMAGAQNFNFANKFPQNRCLTPFLHFGQTFS